MQRCDQGVTVCRGSDTAAVPKIHQLALDPQRTRARHDGCEQIAFPAGQCNTLLLPRPAVEHSTTTRRPSRCLV